MSTRAELCQAWLDAKARETAANNERVAIETALVRLVGAKAEGATTTDEDGFKVTTTGKMTRKLDVEAYLKVADSIPADRRPVKTKLELDETGFKWLRDNDPATFALVAPCITTKPAKTSVEVRPTGA